MRERPILFSAPMVQAILTGEKTQTRRVIKGAPAEAQLALVSGAYSRPDEVEALFFAGPTAESEGLEIIKCPYGEPGDRLWVRESWQPIWKTEKRPPLGLKSPEGWDIGYPATDGVQEYLTESGLSIACKPSIHMPRWASRILLEITDIRAERLRDISEADAKAEGAPTEFEVDVATFVHGQHGQPLPESTHYLGFKHLWKEINGKDSWQQNPWVWAISFKQVETEGVGE